MEELRKAHEDGVVLGLKGALGVAPRLDIDVFIMQYPDCFNLFCLAMLDLMNCDTDDLMGFYQLAGIHGFPRGLWDDIPSWQKDVMGATEKLFSGYCAHSSVLFPTWHRPYVAMMEQTIFIKIAEIAEKFPSDVRASYREAAKQFRLPYWDYFRPRGGRVEFPGVGAEGKTSYPYDFRAPDIFTTPTIMLRTTEKNELVKSENPFCMYEFPSAGGIPEKDWGCLKRVENFSKEKTQRFPQSENPVQDFSHTLNKHREDSIRYAMNIIADYDSYDNLWDTKNSSKSGSLEGLHNDYHDRIGGLGGHMSQVPTAAFDPMFWHHHTQVDRLFAIWQKAHPDEWFDADDIDLTPMRKSKTPEKFWNSKDSRTTTAFGYTYPDLDDDPQKVKDDFTKDYAWATEKNEANPTPPSNMAPLDMSNAQIFRYSDGSYPRPALTADLESKIPQISLQNTPENIHAASTDPAASTSLTFHSNDETTSLVTESGDSVTLPTTNAIISLPKPTSSREWYISYEVERMALNGSFTIHYFLGDPPESEVSTAKYLTWPTLASSNHVFAAPVKICKNCEVQRRSSHIVANEGHLTAMLKDYMAIGELIDLEPKNVKWFLGRSLKWRIVAGDGTKIDPRAIPSLKFKVSSKLKDEEGKISYEEFPEVVDGIIAGSSKEHRRPTGIQRNGFAATL